MCRKLTWLVSIFLLLSLGHYASAATNPYPADGATDVPIDVVLSWSPGHGALMYDVYFGTSSPPPWIGKLVETSYDPGTLEPGTTYFWRVNDFTAMGTNPGPVWSFTTMSGPKKATNPYPADGAEDVPLDITLSWDPASGATSHDVYFGTSSSPPFIGNQTADNYNPGTLEPGVDYYWRIDTVRQVGELFIIYTGDVWSFTTMSGPEKATNPYPTDDAEDVSLNITLSWDPASVATSQDVYFGTNSSPPFIGNQTASTYNPGTLEPCRDYYWRIDTVRQIGEFFIIYTGDVWNFTTMSGPEKATNPYPADGAEDVPLDTVLSWYPGSRATSHDVYFGTSSSPPFIGNQTSSDYNPGTLEPGTTYYWKINEVLTMDGEPPIIKEGDVWDFTTGLAVESLVFYQMDFNLGGTIYTDTEWGSVDFTFIGEDPIMYFNLAINGTWQVQNIPVLSIKGVGVEQTMTYYFDMGTPRGTNVNNLNYDYAFTPNILDTMPGLSKPALVVDDYIAMWPGFGGSMPLLALAKPLIGGKVVSSDKKYAHKDFPNQECGKRECVPAAVSNSLQFLNKKYKLGMDPNKISIDEMKTAVGWDPNGAPLYDWWAIKKKYMEDNDYPITTRKITDMNDLIREMKDGQDIEITESWPTLIDPNGDPNDPNNITTTGHVSALIGITPLKDGRYSLDVAEDKKQNEPGGCDKLRSIIYDPNDPNGSFCVPGCGYTDFEYAVVECPSYIPLDYFELYDDPRGMLAIWTDGRSASTITEIVSNNTGSLLDLIPDPINSDNQCMAINYANDILWPAGYHSKVELIFEEPQDWDRPDIEIVSLSLMGLPGNSPEPVYLGLEDSNGISTQAYYPCHFAPLLDTWEQWHIDLDHFHNAGVDLQSIQVITIGVGDPDNTSIPGGVGTMLIDDIRLIAGESAEEIQDCGPTQEELTPPPTPEGYVYIGYNVVVNFVLTDYTVPLDRPDSPEDLIFVRSHTIVKGGVTACDVIVTHVFAPISQDICQ